MGSDPMHATFPRPLVELKGLTHCCALTYCVGTIFSPW